MDFSNIGFGTWQFGSLGKDDYWGVEYTQEMATEYTIEAVANGIRYFDTAEGYSDGRSETQLGIALKQFASEKRQNVLIGSKIQPDHCNDVRHYVGETLKRLQVDCIDLMMVHWPISASAISHFSTSQKNASGGRDYAAVDDNIPQDIPTIQNAMKVLAELQKEGKIKHIGLSNFGKTQMQEVLDTGVKIAVNQVCFSYLFRASEFEILPFCQQHGIQVIAYSPLMQGLCLGHWCKVDDVPTFRSRTRHFNQSNSGSKSRHGEEGHEKLLFETIENVRKISIKHGISMLDLSVAYPLHKGISCVIVGATKLSQVEGNAKAGKINLTDDIVKEMDEATEALKNAMGSNCDLWQGKDDSRIH